MSTPNQEAIETFVNITGVSEATAIQKLQPCSWELQGYKHGSGEFFNKTYTYDVVEHDGDLNEAVNAYFTEGDRNLPQFSIFSPRRNSDLFSLLDSNFRRNIFYTGSGFTRDAPIVSQPSDLHEIPIDFKNGNKHSSHSGGVPAIEDVTGIAEVNGPVTRGIVTIEDDDDKDFIASPVTHAANNSSMGAYAPAAYSRPSTPGIDDLFVGSNDIEEEMIRAAIEASKQDTAVPLFDDNDSRLSMPCHLVPVKVDLEFARAIELSLETAERERAMHELVEGGRVSEFADLKFAPAEDLQKLSSSDRWNVGNSSVHDQEAEDREEQPLVQHRSTTVSSSFVNAEAVDCTQLSTSQHRLTPSHAKRSSIQSGKVDGISSEEQDEAVMLEVTMFGAIPEDTGYRFPFAPHSLMQICQNENVDPYVWGRPRPPSPSLAVQQLLRAQQDDEYLALLQAEREKEMKADEEADAASAEWRGQADESLRKLEEEQGIERRIAAKEASPLTEPSLDDENAVTLLAQMPDGSHRGRRFLESDKLQFLVDYIDVGGGVKPGSYRLVRPCPERAFSDEESASTLNELGLTSKQEALFLERGRQ